MKDKFSKFINLQGKYLTSLLFVLFFAVGQMWADPTYKSSFTDFTRVGETSEYYTMLTSSNYSGYISAGWMSYTGASTGSATLKINPATDEAISGSSATYGKVKNDGSRYMEFYVTGISSIKFYFANTGSSDRKIQYKLNAGEATDLVTVVQKTSNSGSISLSSSTNNTIRIFSPDNDVYACAIKVTVASTTTYTVTYKAGDGSGSDVVDSDAKTVKAFADCSFTAPSGYEFKEWQDGSSNVVAEGATVSTDMTLTAIYRLIPTKYTVTYSLNGASGDAPTETDKAEGDVFNLAAAPSWAGHAFDGWLCSADAAVKAAGSSYTMTAANTTFTAQWHEVDCKIYSLTGEIGSAAAEADASNVEISAASLVLKSSNAIIKLTPGEGTFKAGDVLTISGTVGNTSKNFGVKISASNNKGSGLGLASVAGTSNPMVATATLSADADYLYICRDGGTTQTLLTCEVHRSCAEGTAAGLGYAEAEVNKTEGDAAFTNPLTNANSLVLDGYKSSNEEVATVNFSTGEVTIVGAGSATITANSAIQTKAGTLYAAGSASYTLTVAALPKYHVTYDLNGGSGDVAEVDHKAGEKFTLHDGVTGVTAPGSKTFVNWKDQDDALFNGGVEYTMPAKDVTLTAQWAGDVYTVIFKDGETELGTKLFEVGSNPSDADIDKTKALFTFAAWQKDDADIALDAEFWATVAKDATVTLNARWTKAYASNADFEAYIIANKDEKDDADKAEAYVKSLNYALSTKTNTTFDANDETNNGAYAGLKIKNSGTKLSWNVVAGKVVELKAGVMVANGSLAINGGAATTIDGGSITAGNDNFKIHYFYSAAEALYEFTTSNGSAEVIKAITMRDPYEVSFDVNGGDAPIAAMYGTPSVTLPTPTKGSDSFTGWFDAETGGNKIGDAGASYIPTANITLHAQWESVSTDARLASISLDPSTGTLEPAFNPELVDYTYTIPYAPNAAIPQITGATAVNPNAKEPVIVQQASAWNETAIIRGVAQSDDTKAYNITMQIAPKDGVSIIKVATTGGTNKTVTGLYAGDGDVNLSSSKKMDNGKYIGFILDGTTLQAGDRINVHTTTAANTEGSHIIFYDNMTDKNELYETGEIGGLGDNIFTINAAMVGQASAYVYRANNDAAHQWNGYVDFIEVTRAMNPVLTAITFDGVNAEPGVGNTFSALLPNGTNLASMTVTPTIVWNGAGSAAPTAAWDWGNNTYRVTDKDGDFTDYTITLTEAAAPSAAPEITTQPVGDDYIEGATIDALEVVATGSGELSYQWYLGADAIDGATNATYTPTVTAIGSYVYHCVVTNTEAGHPATSLASSNATITISEDPAAIKLLDSEGEINTTNFTTGVSKGTVTISEVSHNCASFGSTGGSIVGLTGLNKVVAYNATTTQTKVKFILYNENSSPKEMYLQKVLEGATEAVTETIAVPSKEYHETQYYEYNSSDLRSFYVTVNSTNIKILQVKVIDNGTVLKRAGEAGYELNLNKGRVFGAQNTATAFEGLAFSPSSNAKVLNSTELPITTPLSFTIASPLTLAVTTSAAKYYVSQNSAEDGTTATAVTEVGEKEFDLTVAGTWYIVPSTTSAVKLTNIAFSAPKCEKPAFNALVNSDLCSGDPYVALDGTGSVTDGGTITYKWYAEGGTDVLGTNATYTPAADGNYYVVALHHVDGFTDNEATSDVVSVTHFASAAITTAPKDQRVDAGQNATLTVVASGKAPLTYQWYTCDDETGANPVIIDGAESDSYVVAVTSGFSQYYKVVVSSGCGEASAVAKVEEWTELPQLDVTASMTWDWTYAGENNKLVTGKNVEIVMANIRENDKIPTNDATFRSQALLFYGENVRATEGGRNYASIGHIAFHTTVPGVVIVEFSDNGSNNRRVSINGKLSEASAAKTDVKTFSANVPAGDVTIMGVEEDGSGSNKYIRISKIEFVKVDYTRPVTAGRLGTICLPNGGKMYGAGLYEIAYFDATAKKIFFDEIINGEMIAGRPYIFLPNEGVDLLAVAYTDNADADAGNYKGLYGSYTQEELGTDGSNYILLNNQYCRVVEAHTYVGANRAYIKLGEIGTTPYAAAPGRRRISMGVTGENQAQGFENLQSGDQPMKVMIDGTLYIIRGEKVFDATGRLVK